MRDKLKYCTEYHNSLGSEAEGAGANFIEYALGSSFACTCTIPFHNTVFGSSTTPFATKKAARANAAKEAVQFLIAHGLTDPDGNVKTRKKGNPGKSVTVEGKALEVKMDATYAQKVNGVSTEFSPSFLHGFLITYISKYRQADLMISNLSSYTNTYLSQISAPSLA